MRDVTERRMLEEQLRQAQKMEAVGQLAGGIAHDFNNLLTVIGGYGEIARRRIGAGPGAAELLEVERAAERATQLTKQLLAFSRQQMLDPVPLDLAEIAGGLLPMLRRLIGEDIEIAMLTDNGLPAVLADRAQLEQVLVNLAVNARDAMPTGGTLTIETRAVTLDDAYAERHAGVEPGEYVCLTVTDTGVGMRPETLSRVFEPFFTTKAVGQGTGLGLATVHGIVNQSGGHILVYSEPDLGTSFKAYLPATGAATPAEDGDQRSELDRLGGSETILLCEDEDGVRQLIEHVLTAHGYRVLATGGPHEAVERASEHGAAIDALVSDVIMPDMSGPELARRLESVRPGLRTLFVSGYTAETVRDRGRLPEDSAFLEKPFDQLSLLRAVRALLGRPARRAG
jgi:nitrogen-specific signal transduction histidine kinase